MVAAASWLVERASPGRLAEVVSAVCGIHAQVTSAAELSIAARVDGLTRDDVRAALWSERTLAKTWTVRGTLHLHPAEELPLWAAARRAVEPPWGPERFDPFGITPEQAAAILAAIGDALRGSCLTREELGDAVAARVGPWAKAETPVIQFGRPALVWPQLLGDAAWRGSLCHGPPRGNRVTFVRADEWVEWRDVDPDFALREVCRRYLAAYGPATPAELAHWFHAPPAVVEGLWDEVRVPEPEPLVPPLRLLPAYDCYVIGAAPPGPKRERLVPDPAVRDRVFGRGAGPFEVLLLDGVVGGVWKGTRSARRVELSVEPFRRLTRTERRELEEEAARIGAFLGLEAVLGVGPLAPRRG